MMLAQVVIKELTTPAEIYEITMLDKSIWTVTEIPSHQLLAAVRNGGLLLGAYLHDELIGFCYGFAGLANGEPYLYSHILSILQPYREQGISELLKYKQKEIALARGYKVIFWGFDPLDVHAALRNFTNLGAVSESYYEDFYRTLAVEEDFMLPTDRVGVNWWLLREPAEMAIDELEEEAQLIVPWQLTTVGLPALITKTFSKDARYTANAYLLAVPNHFQKIHVESPVLAEDWRFKIRDILLTLFAQGYVIVRLIQQDNAPVAKYLLIRRALLAL